MCVKVCISIFRQRRLHIVEGVAYRHAHYRAASAGLNLGIAPCLDVEAVRSPEYSSSSPSQHKYTI